MHHLSRFLLILFTALVMGQASATANNAIPSVGAVSMVLGKAYISQAGGRAVLIKAGSPVHVNDVIETTSSGHVHIRFVDNELVSVRPLSTLEVVLYDYDPQDPQNSAVKLKVEGVTRAISGQAATKARQNFRMNTPIAAIGVRGTDFTVNATQYSVRAIVNEGAIIVAPFSSQCSAASLGPCSQSQDAVELSALSRQILEINAGTAGVTSALLPASSTQAQTLVARAAAEANTTGTKDKETNELYTDTVTTRTVNTTLASNSADPVKETPPPTPPVVLPPEFTPDVAQTPEELTTNTQLVWGRWNNLNLENERISVSYEVAILNGRQTAGGSLVYPLFRAEPNGAVLQPGLGELSFDLTKAQAFYKEGGRSELMDVSGGKLKLDFEEALFSTNLQLSHAATGKIELVSSGSISAGGYFHAYTDTQSLAGAASVDGKEAGYYFEKILTSGASIEGITLWSKQP